MRRSASLVKNWAKAHSLVMVRLRRSTLPKLLWPSRGPRWGGGCGEQPVDLSGDVPLEAADGLLRRLAVRLSSDDVGGGAGIPGHAGDGEDVEGVVGLAVAAAVSR